MWLLVGYTFCLLVIAACAVFGNELDRETFFKHALDSRVEFTPIAEDAIVEVNYLEYVLTSWVLEGRSWNAYHSGIGFVVTDRDGKSAPEYYHVDFQPRMTGEIKHVLVPEIVQTNKIQIPEWLPRGIRDVVEWITADYRLTWNNEGSVFFTSHWPTKYTNVTKVGKTNGTVYNKMRPWFFEYQDKHRTFEPVEIIDAMGTVLHQSELCHDLFYRALDAFHDLGFVPKATRPIFRDHVMILTSSIREANTADDKRAIARFYRLYDSFIDVINQEFSNIRSMFMGTYLLSVSPFIFKGNAYQEVQMVSPYINYCYMEVVMPPKPKAHFYKDQKLCGLGSTLSKEMSWKFLGHLKPFHFVFLIETLFSSWKGWITLLFVILGLLYVQSSLRRKNGKILDDNGPTLSAQTPTKTKKRRT